MPFKVFSFLSYSSECHCQQLIEPTLTNPFLFFSIFCYFSATFGSMPLT